MRVCSSVPVVRVHGPLKKLAGGTSEHSVSGDCVSSVLRALEQEHPALAGWVLDERGTDSPAHQRLRKRRAWRRRDTGRSMGDRVEVLPRSREVEAEVTELLVGTKKGLFVLDGGHGAGFEVIAARVRGRARRICDAGRADRPAVRRRQFTDLRAKDLVHRRSSRGVDPGKRRGSAGGRRRRAGAHLAGRRRARRTACCTRAVIRACCSRAATEGRAGSSTPRCGTSPPASSWQPGGGGLCLHSIVPWPGDPSRLLVAVSAAGVWLTDDGGRSWRRGNRGLAARYEPEEVQETHDRALRSPHRALAEAARAVVHAVPRWRLPIRRSAARAGWRSAKGCVSDFGFPLAVDPDDPDSAFVIPLQADVDRVTPEGRVRVFETRDAGATHGPVASAAFRRRMPT